MAEHWKPDDERAADENNAERHALDCTRRLVHDLRSVRAAVLSYVRTNRSLS